MGGTASATAPQINYIEYLAIDLGYDRVNRNWAIEAIISRPVKFLDELTVVEASRVIEDFKARKEALWNIHLFPLLPIASHVSM